MDKRLIYGGLAIVGGVILARTVTAGAPERPKVIPGQSRVYLLGDSLAVGLSAPLKSLAKDDRMAFSSTATSGSRIDQWARDGRVDATLGRFRPTVVLVSLGTNDAYMMGGEQIAASQQAKAEQLLAKLRSGGAEVVWIGPPTLPASSAGHARNEAMLSMVRGLVPPGAYFPSDKLIIPRGPDNLHPSARGYAAWAGCLWRWLRKAPGQCEVAS